MNIPHLRDFRRSGQQELYWHFTDDTAITTTYRNLGDNSPAKFRPWNHDVDTTRTAQRATDVCIP